MKEVLIKMIEHRNLTREEARNVMLRIADGAFNDALLSAFMTVFLMRSITLDELSGFRAALMDRKVDVKLDAEDVIDIVGTGGDGKNTFNISTCACFVTAGAGYRVVKHGNYGASSVSGASNVLEYSGVKFTNDSGKLSRSLDETGIAYLHAPLFNSAMKAVGPVRKALGLRTFINMLGPLVNPVMPKKQLLGVYNLKLMRLYSYLTREEGIDCTVVHSLDGYDEISLTSPFKVSGALEEKIYTPEEAGFGVISQSDLFGGDTIAEAADIFYSVLDGTSTVARKNCVIANAAFAIRTLEPALPLEEAIEKARYSLESGNALRTFKKYVELNS